jgi:hypothetical protein
MVAGFGGKVGGSGKESKAPFARNCSTWNLVLRSRWKRWGSGPALACERLNERWGWPTGSSYRIRLEGIVSVHEEQPIANQGNWRRVRRNQFVQRSKSYVGASTENKGPL